MYPLCGWLLFGRAPRKGAVLPLTNGFPTPASLPVIEKASLLLDDAFVLWCPMTGATCALFSDGGIAVFTEDQEVSGLTMTKSLGTRLATRHRKRFDEVPAQCKPPNRRRPPPPVDGDGGID
jgi:hypothetical protein